jgi:copper(I)-binding protein
VIQRRAVVGIVFAVSASLLAACGFEAPDVESTEHNSVQATDFRVGAIRVADTSITPATVDGLTGFYLIVTIVNDGSTSDTLTGATTPNGAVTLSVAGLPLLPGVPVEVGLPSADSTTPTMTVVAASTPQAGDFVPIVLDFAKAGASPTAQVPVVPAGETTAATQPVPTATATVPTEVGATASD